ncbi:MAG: DEAD/DEAH box helicase [Acholeplasmataceae bacterium]
MYIKEKIKQLNFNKITPIQAKVFANIDNAKHIVGLAPTGTGKTHAYLLPIFAKLDFDLFEVQAIIVVPTNELVIQIEQMITAFETDLILKTYYGSKDKKKESAWLEKKQPQVVVATPAQLLDYVVNQQALRIQNAKYVVLDEADMFFDDAFIGELDQILSITKRAKLLLFSATLTKAMHPFIKAYFGDFLLIDTSKEHKLKIEYQLVDLKSKDRLEALIQIVEDLNPYLCFIFVSKKENQKEVFDALHSANYEVLSFSSEVGVKHRKRLIEDIHALKYQFVVTSDLTARGLDFKISHIINFDLPHHLEFFFHRSGRTGRMYDSGIVITLAQTKDKHKIEKLEKRGIVFRKFVLTPQGMKQKMIKMTVRDESMIEATKAIPKAKKVSPNHKKKNKQAILKKAKQIRRKKYADYR